MPEFTKSARRTDYHCFTPLTDEQRSHVGTAAAAYHLNRTPQTLRVWACYGKGPITCTRIQGRLAWPVEQLRTLLCGSPV
jgi:hypothetical protein